MNTQQIWVGGPHIDVDRLREALRDAGVQFCWDSERFGGRCQCVSHPEFASSADEAAFAQIAERLASRTSRY